MGAAGGVSSLLSMQSTVMDTYAQSEAIKMRGEFNKRQADMNAGYADQQAMGAEDRGNKAANQQILKGRQLEARQRVAMAATGQTGADVIASTRFMSENDAATIKNNAAMEAWGYRTQSINYTTQGRFDQAAADSERRNTLLTGGMRLASAGASAYGSGGGAAKARG